MVSEVLERARNDATGQGPWVIVEEVKSGDWGIGGKPLSTEDVKALAAGAPA